MDTRKSVTHTPQEVFNQTSPLVEYNLFATDAALRDSVRREHIENSLDELTTLGARLGRLENFEAGRLANQYPPVLKTHDQRGNRIDRVEFHPAWHALMRGMIGHGFHSGPWADHADRHSPSASSHAVRAAAYLMQAQIEQGSLCPVTMTYGAIPAMKKDPWLAAEWVPKLVSLEYDPRDLPLTEKSGALIGMGMTERQGGSDVRANTTVALRQPDRSYRLRGHKWFFSAPQCDAHLVLAQAAAGLSCFLVPRFESDGSKNALRIQRLKDKVGNRSNASSEVEFDDAWGHLLGEEGRGVATILEMGTYTRLDCAIGTAGMMRQALVQAIHHACHRATFGRLLIDQPLMQSVLADLAIESEAATALALRIARAFDSTDEAEVAFRRVMTSAAKFWICKRGPHFAAEAMDVLGGNGYVEEGPLARIYREMPLNSIWEGSANIMCLDVLRAFSKSKSVTESVLKELEAQRGSNSAYDHGFERIAAALATGAIEEADARTVVQQLATVLQASLLLQSGPGAVAEAYCATRLSDERGGSGAVYGTLPGNTDRRAIIDRAWSE